jgi:hypothetical protein
MRQLILAGSLLFVSACNPKPVPPDANGTSAPPAGAVSSEDADRKEIEKLEAEARALANVSGCTASGDCRVAPIGVRGCGGPRDFIVYCGKTTDSAALMEKIEAADSAEAAFNRKHQVISTCELRMPPAVESSGGSCRAR